MSTSIVWFRTDLRLDDNLSLIAAVRASEQVLPLFVWDPERPTYNSVNRLSFMIESLQALEADLKSRGSRLIVRRGEPASVLLDLASETGATKLFFGRHYEPYEIARDNRVKETMLANGIEVTTQKESILFEAGEILTKEGKPYTVYTPFKNSVWPRLRDIPKPIAIPNHLKPHHTINQIESVDLGGFLPSRSLVAPERQSGGVLEAEKLWQRFRAFGLGGYAEHRDSVGDQNGTSRIAPHLKFGTISIRRVLYESLQLLDASPEMSGAETYIRELLWREFYSNILQAFPHVASGPFQREYAGLKWSNNEEHFTLWCEGRTGVPIVDAAMRELLQTGYMHNRARMIVASFLVKDLQINWQLGELHFMKHLTDGDLAQNNGGWQWTASTGTDAQPYYRIFNPYLQSKKFDADGVYIRRYVAELRPLPSSLIHEPHLMTPFEQAEHGITIGEDYPLPIVDHYLAREKTKAMYDAVRKLRYSGDRKER